MYERVRESGRGLQDPVRVATGRRRVQRRLSVGRADDPAEREADAIAAQVIARLRTGDGPGAEEMSAGAARPSRIRRASAGDALGGAALSSDAERQVRSGGDARGATAVLRRMESAFGADFGDVGLHTGTDVDVAAEGLQARAFTVGRDVYIRRQDYRPGTSAGDELIAHELAHTLQQGASRIRRRAVDPVDVRERLGGSHVSFKKQKMHVDFVRMKRINTGIVRELTAKALSKLGAKELAETVAPDDGVGHWWVEVGNLSPDRTVWEPIHSYGWYPHEAYKQTLLNTLALDTPVPGQLNKGRPNDPHHGDAAGVQFHPVMEIDDSKGYWPTRGDISVKIDSFAHAFKGTWNWRLGWGKNCHTFQDRMRAELGMHHQTSKLWFQAPPEEARAVSLDERWYPLIDKGDEIHRYGIDPEPTYTWEELQALSDDEKRHIIDLTHCTVADLNEWARVSYRDHPEAARLFG